MTEGPELTTEWSIHVDPSSFEDPNEEIDSNSEDNDFDPSDVAMVPMADLLNARWGSENVSSVLSDLCVSWFLLYILKLLSGEVILRTIRAVHGNDKEYKTRRANCKHATCFITR